MSSIRSKIPPTMFGDVPAQNIEERSAVQVVPEEA